MITFYFNLKFIFAVWAIHSYTIVLTKVIAETLEHADIDTRKSDRVRNMSSKVIRLKTSQHSTGNFSSSWVNVEPGSWSVN